jgi:signal peptidase I
VDNVRATWTLPVEYLRTELRASDVDIIAVNGDSMQPTLVPGDRVMINKRQIAPSPDSVVLAPSRAPFLGSGHLRQNESTCVAQSARAQ